MPLTRDRQQDRESEREQATEQVSPGSSRQRLDTSMSRQCLHRKSMPILHISRKTMQEDLLDENVSAEVTQQGKVRRWLVRADGFLSPSLVVERESGLPNPSRRGRKS